MRTTEPLPPLPSDLLTRARVLLRMVRRPIAVAAVTGAAAAFLASGGQIAPAVIAGLLGIAGGIVSLTLTLASVETRWAFRWPRLHLRGWQPRLGSDAGRAHLPQELPEALFFAGEAALSHCGAARRILGVRASRFGRRVVGLVRKGEAAFERAAAARTFLEASAGLTPPADFEGCEIAQSEIARVVRESARARCVREQQVELRLRAAEAEVAGATQVLEDLALRLSGIEAELSAAEAERRQLLPCLRQLHEEMSALEQAAMASPSLDPAQTPLLDLEVAS